MSDTPKTDLVKVIEDFRSTVINWITAAVKQRPGARFGFATPIPILPSDEDIVSELAESIWFDEVADELMIVTRDLNDNTHKSDPAYLFTADVLIAISDKFKSND